MKKAVKRKVCYRKYYREPVALLDTLCVMECGSDLLLRKGIWNVAEDGLGAVHSEHNLIFILCRRCKLK